MKLPALTAAQSLRAGSQNYPLPGFNELSLSSSAQMITVCGYQFVKDDFHKILKPQILDYIKTQGISYEKRVGDNPDIECTGHGKKAEIVLVGQTKKGGKVSTGQRFLDVLQALGHL